MQLFDKLGYRYAGDTVTISRYAELRLQRIKLAEKLSVLPQMTDTIDMDDIWVFHADAKARQEAEEKKQSMREAKNL